MNDTPETNETNKSKTKTRTRRRRTERAERAERTEVKARPQRRKSSSARSAGGYFKIGCSAVFLLFVLILLIFIIHTFMLYSHAKKGMLNTDEKKGREEFTVTVEIPQGASLKVISETLEDAGIIESPFFFRMKAQSEGVSYSFNSGTFTLSNYMTFDELAATLSGAGSEGDYVRFTVIEGQSVFDVAENLEVIGVCTAEEFLDVCQNGDFDYDFIADIPENAERENRLEGYLFPDTYFLGNDVTAYDVANMMLSNFNTKVYEGIYKSAPRTEYTLDDYVIIASIIEKEVKADSERPIVASVIFNRLEIGMKLQMDATVLYAKQEHKGRVFESDTQFESAYNTYQVEGLPAGPIGNAGLSSFEGAFEPAETDYIYYVLENTETGEHYFTDDYDDFLRAKEQYISGL